LSRQAGAPPRRIESCPPAAGPSPAGWSARLLDWLGQGWNTGDDTQNGVFAAPAQRNRLESIRIEFAACLDDVPTHRAADLRYRIARTRSLYELWHMRTEVFVLVSRHTDETQATSRLSRLNRHFPARAPRSGFGGFDALPHTPDCPQE
jgi:hypothetical protein